MIVWFKMYFCFWSMLWKNRKNDPLAFTRKANVRYKNYGLKVMLNKFKEDCTKQQVVSIPFEVETPKSYKLWIRKSEENILETETLEYNPLISIITPTYNTKKIYLIEMLESVVAQTYTNWELCIADDASKKKRVIKILREYTQKYKNIKVTFREQNGHISKASNSALKLASGEYVAFLDHDDALAPNALYEMVKKLNENKKLKLLYSDEDKMDKRGRRFHPNYKPQWNRDMFFSQNYICHLVCLKKEIVDKVDGFRVGYEGSQDYDLLLRSLEHIKDTEIASIQKVLYHWRAIVGSTAFNEKEKDYTQATGRKALQDFFTKKDENIVIEDGLSPNTFKVIYPLVELPLVTILIPTKDGYEILYKCVESILEKTSYKNYEIIILDNETTCEKTLEYFQKIKQKQNITILEYHYPFNYSSINNFGVQNAEGEVIALLNNDVEVINEGWLTEMLQHATRQDIGAVGAMLYYDNNTVQHAGVVVGLGGVAGHSHKYFKRGSVGYFSRLKIVQNYSAVTAACLVVRKKLFLEVNGLDEKNLTVAFNDVDFCLKLQEKGYRNLWTPYAELYHHESISRGFDDTPEKKRRFEQEMMYMQGRWSTNTIVDTYYNDNLTKVYENFGVAYED